MFFTSFQSQLFLLLQDRGMSSWGEVFPVAQQTHIQSGEQRNRCSEHE